MDLTISIVSTKDVSILKKCLHSIFANIGNITYEVIVVNNASGSHISAMVKADFPKVKLIENAVNKGFTSNHNNVINNSSGDSILIMNPDIYVENGFFGNLLGALKADNAVGIVMGKLLQPGVGCRKIDSTGLTMYKSRRTSDRGQGELDKGQYDQPGEIFSASGAAMLCRRSMLEDIKLFGDYLDSSYMLYKEELDLCWRARLKGWKVIYTPNAIATHDRGWGAGTKRTSVPRWIRRESYKNRYLTILKNDHLINILLDLPFILWHEVKALGYIIFREPHLLIVWPQILFQLPLIIRKRAKILGEAKLKPSDIRKWFK